MRGKKCKEPSVRPCPTGDKEPLTGESDRIEEKGAVSRKGIAYGVW